MLQKQNGTTMLSFPLHCSQIMCMVRLGLRLFDDEAALTANGLIFVPNTNGHNIWFAHPLVSTGTRSDSKTRPAYNIGLRCSMFIASHGNSYDDSTIAMSNELKG